MNQFLNITPAEYHQINALSQSRIKKMCETSPLHATMPTKATAAMDFGAVVDAICFETGGYVVSPHDEFRTNEAKAWRDAQTVPIIKEKDFRAAETLALHISNILKDLTRGAATMAQQAMIWKMDSAFGPVACKGLIDLWCPEHLLAIDVKIASKGVSDDLVERYFADYGCAIQSKFYRQGLGKIMPEAEGRIKFLTVLFEPGPPFQHRVCINSGAYDVLAETQISYGAHHYAEGMKTGKWRGYSSELFIVTPKPWVTERWLEDEVEAV